MNCSNLIMYSLGEKVSLTDLKRKLGDDWKEAVDNGFFELIGNKDDEPIYVFTQKGKDAAWGK